MKQMNESAVSPVVGVMLLLVVTIVIAAVVSAFAGGITSDEEKAPQAAISCESMIKGVQDTDLTNYKPDYPGGFEVNNGLLFQHEGGEPFSIDDIQVQIQSKDRKTTIDSTMGFNSTGSCVDETKLNHRTVNGEDCVTYFYKYAGDSGNIIMPGDKFVLVADGCYGISTALPSESMDEKYITWQPKGAKGRFDAQIGTKLEFKIIDKNSGKSIQTGSVTLY